MAAVALAGWTTGVHLLTYLVPGHPPMVPNTALALLLLAAGGAARARPGPPALKVLATVSGGVAAAIGLVTLGEYLFHGDAGIDRWFFAASLNGPAPGRPSPPTALALLLLGGAVIAFEARPRRGLRPAEWLALPAALIGLTVLVAHAHGAGPVYQWARGSVIGVSLPTAMALLVISSGLLLLPPAVGLMALVTSGGPGGLLVRRLGAGAIVGPPLLGLGASHLVTVAGFADISLALALLTTLMVPFGVFVVVVTATRLERTHRALEVGRERIRALVDLASEGIFVADLQGRYVDVNDAGCRLLGRERADILGKTIVDLISPEEVPRLWAIRDQLLQGGTSVAEWNLLRGDGTRVAVEVSASILPDGRWQGLVRDITERKAAEREAQRSRARLEGIISISSDAIISIDDQQRITLYNEGAAATFGWSRDELLGQPLDRLLPERLRPLHRAHVGHFAAEGVSARRMGQRSPIVGLRRNGEEFPADASISKVDIEGRQFFTVVLRDITERAAMERELREARDFLDNVLQSSLGYSIVALDLDRRIVLWNEGARRNHGFDAPEVLRQSVDLLHAPDDLASGLAPSLYAAARERGMVEEVLTLLRKDGTGFAAQVVVARRSGADGAAIGYLLMARDISREQRQTEHERLLAEAGVALASTLDADAVLDRFARLAVVGMADCCFIELADHEALGRPHTVEHRDPRRAGLSRALEQLTVDRSRPHLAWSALQRRRSVLVSHVTPDYLASLAQSPAHQRLLEALAPQSFMAVPILQRDELLGAVVFVSSAPARRYEPADLARAEEVVGRLALALDNARLYETARQAIARRDEVLGIVAHDLRSPLAAARLGADALLSRRPEEDRRKVARQVAERIGRSLDRANRLIDDLLDISRIDAGHLTVAPEAIAPERLVRDAIDLVEPAAAAAGLNLSMEVQAQLPLVWADATRLSQVLSNLLGNAIKFVPAGGHIRLSVERQQDLVRFAVSDDGPGIAAEHVAHLFDRFWQAKSSDRRGAGLGLAIAKGIVEAHGGELSVATQPGAGTTFTFVLRPAPATLPAGASAAP